MTDAAAESAVRAGTAGLQCIYFHACCTMRHFRSGPAIFTPHFLRQQHRTHQQHVLPRPRSQPRHRPQQSRPRVIAPHPHPSTRRRQMLPSHRPPKVLTANVRHTSILPALHPRQPVGGQPHREPTGGVGGQLLRGQGAACGLDLRRGC